MNFNHNDFITVGLGFLLFGIACAVMGYFIGRKHGHDAGYQAGTSDATFHNKGRLLSAKKDGAKTVLNMFRRQGRPVSEILEDRMHRAFSEYRN